MGLKTIDLPIKDDEEDFSILLYISPPLVQPQQVLGLLTYERRHGHG